MNASFSNMLYADLQSERLALLKATEEKHRTLYIEKPRLEQAYMDKIGDFEAEVLEAELEVRLLRRKLELIQACINRREPIDMEKINEAIEEERQELIQNINSSSGSNAIIHDDEATNELQSLYNDILKQFHPEINPDITPIQRDLYERAVEAYKTQDLESMKLIHRMLFDEEDGIPMELSVEFGFAFSEENDLNEAVEKYATDYQLAEKLYPWFKAQKKDEILKAASEKFRKEVSAVLDEIQKIKSNFPFIATEVIANDSKGNEYLNQLKYRMLKAQNDKKELEQKVNEMAGVMGG